LFDDKKRPLLSYAVEKNIHRYDSHIIRYL
jgi:hypothetical protein